MLGKDGFPIIVSNGIAAVCALLLLFAKLTFKDDTAICLADTADIEQQSIGAFEGYRPLGTMYGSTDSTTDTRGNDD